MSAGKLKLQRVEEPFVFRLENAEGIVTYIDAAAAIGGKGRGLRPMELLAGSLATCVSIDVLNVLRKKRIDVQDFRVEIETFRSESVPSPFRKIILRPVAEGVAVEEVKKLARKVLDKYCSVSASLAAEIEIQVL